MTMTYLTRRARRHPFDHGDETLVRLCLSWRWDAPFKNIALIFPRIIETG
jgi:hypothetical protein